MSKLKAKREAAGLSQAQLAKAVNTTLRNITAYEAEATSAHRDINKAEAYRVWRISQVLGCDISEILEEVDE